MCISPHVYWLLSPVNTFYAFLLMWNRSLGKLVQKQLPISVHGFPQLLYGLKMSRSEE
jgi:hypothetical protein